MGGEPAEHLGPHRLVRVAAGDQGDAAGTAPQNGPQDLPPLARAADGPQGRGRFIGRFIGRFVGKDLFDGQAHGESLALATINTVPFRTLTP